jgi:hypothetical protein
VKRTLILFATSFVFWAAHSELSTWENNHFRTFTARSKGVAICLSRGESGIAGVPLLDLDFLGRYFPVSIRLGRRRRDHEMAGDHKGQSYVSRVHVVSKGEPTSDARIDEKAPPRLARPLRIGSRKRQSDLRPSFGQGLRAAFVLDGFAIKRRARPWLETREEFSALACAATEARKSFKRSEPGAAT